MGAESRRDIRDVPGHPPLCPFPDITNPVLSTQPKISVIDMTYFVPKEKRNIL